MKAFTNSSQSPSALAALALVGLFAGCSSSSTQQRAARLASAPGAVLGTAERMPYSGDLSTQSLDRGVISEHARAVVAASDRSESDRMKDDERRPAELLTFLGVEPGWRVAVLVAGSGYTAELLARSVAPSGKVYAENPAFVLASAEKEWSARLATPANP